MVDGSLGGVDQECLQLSNGVLKGVRWRSGNGGEEVRVVNVDSALCLAGEVIGFAEGSEDEDEAAMGW